MPVSEYERGRSDARLDLNDERHKENVRRLEAIEEKLESLMNSMSVAKGGIRILLAVGGSSAAIGVALHSLIAWIVGHWR